MGNVLDPQKQQQVVALGRLGWSLRRIEEATGVRRETVSGYLRTAGVVVRGRGRPRADAPAVPSEATAKPAISPLGVSTDAAPSRSPSTSACLPYQDLITEATGRGRNARAIWQDLVDDHGFTAGYASVRRFVGRLRGASAPAARVVIVTAPGEDYGKCRVMVSIRPGGGFTAAWCSPVAIGPAHNGYSASSQARRSLGGRRDERGGTVSVPADTRASRFISRSLCT